MNLGLTFEKLLLIGVIAALLIGPERFPAYAEGFARLVRRGGELLRDTKGRVRDEMGPEMDDVDWRKLDPRQYDPRRIIREALFEEPAVKTPAAVSVVAPAVAVGASVRPAPQFKPGAPAEFSADSPPPFDPEAT